MTTRTIRQAESIDLQGVRGLLEECSLPSEGLKDQFEEGYCVVVEGAQIVGAGGIEIYGRFGLLRSVVVSPELQSKGLGLKILNDRLAWAAKKGLKEVFLLTTTAERFFKQHGFQNIDRNDAPLEIQKSNEFASICPDSATVMVLVLQDAKEK